MAIKFKSYSQITVESGTLLETVYVCSAMQMKKTIMFWTQENPVILQVKRLLLMYL